MQKLTKKLRMVEEKVAPRKVEGKMPKRTRRNGERKSLEPFPDAQLAMQIPSDEDDERNWTKKRKTRKRWMVKAESLSGRRFVQVAADTLRLI